MQPGLGSIGETRSTFGHCNGPTRESASDCRIIVASAASKVRDLYRHIGSLRQNLFQKDAGFLGPIRPMMIYVGMHVYYDCHAMCIGGAENSAHLRYMIRIIDVNIRVAKMQL